MPSRDGDGKSPEQYRESLITALDSISPRLKAKRRNNTALWVWLLIPVAAIGLNWAQVAAHFGRAPASPVSAALPVRPAELPTQPAETPAPSVRVSPIPATPPQVDSQPQPLSDCMSGGTVVNEQVLRCHFGDRPRERRPNEPSRGMVSAAYLAKYETERDTRSVRGAQNRRIESESHLIEGWDGSGSYLATWQVVDNGIDSSSVCMNYRQGSIKYRECRKGAKQWFKTQCREGNNAGAARQRYCSAASSFNPLG